MNEQIRELAEQANITIRSYYDESGSTLLELEKFAELIVRECAGIVEDAVNHREPASTYVGKIKEHFGVEE